MNWGKGLALAMIAFTGMLGYFLVLAAQNPEPLIADDYYVQELRYQERIDASSRALALSSAVRIDATRDRITLTFPDDVREKNITGTLTLLHAQDPAADRTLVIRNAVAAHLQEPIALRTGRYIAQLDWMADTVTYRSEAHLMVP